MTVKGQPLYSPELTFGNLVFVSGKGAGVKATGDIQAQTKNVLDQIEESLKLAGSSMDKVLKVNVYLTDIKNFEGMNRSYINRFGSEAARSDDRRGHRACRTDRWSRSTASRTSKRETERQDEPRQFQLPTPNSQAEPCETG